MAIELAPPTLRSLLERTELSLRLLADVDAGALDRHARWVHSTDLADPTPFLADDVILLTTGTQFLAAHDDAVDAYVGRLRARGVIALGFGTEVVRDGVPGPLAAACVRHGLPLFEVPYRTPFIALARANAEASAASAYARRTWALDAQRALSRAALRADGLGATLAELSRQLDCWVGLYDAAGTLTRESGPQLAVGVPARLDAEVDAVLRRSARAASSLTVDGTPITLQTLGRGGHLRGVLVIAAGEADAETRAVVTSVVALAGLALEQQQGLGRARAALRAGVVQTLLADDPAIARRTLAELGGLPPEPVHVSVADVPPHHRDAVAEWLDLAGVERAGGVLHGRGDGASVVIVSQDASVGADLAERFGIDVGISDPTGYDRFSHAHAQALHARRPGRGAAAFADVARTGLASELSDAGRAAAERLLAPLRRHDARTGTALLATLTAFLEADCAPERAAQVLGVHRHTVRARLRAVEQVLGRPLDAFATRAELWTAISAAG